MALTFALILALVILGLYLVKLLLFRREQTPLPPGPKPKFLIGNLLDLPKPGELECLHWLKHRDQYGSLTKTRCTEDIHK
jgi:hypothetical protein